MTVRVGLVGAGTMGAQHARLLAREIAGCELAAIADTDAERASRVARPLGIDRVETDGAALIDDPAIDAILVASSDETHFDFTLACIQRGKPVLCEKPLAATSEQCRRLVEAEMAGGTRLVQVGFMRRYDQGYLDMKAALDGGRFGAPLFLHCVHRIASAPHYFTTEIIPHASIVHEIDAARFLLAEDLVRLRVRLGRASSRAPGRHPLFVVFESASGVLVDVEAFPDAQYGYDVRAELVMEAGAIALANPAASLQRHDRLDGHVLDLDWSRRFEAAYRRQGQDWIESIRAGSGRGASAWDGYIATLTAEHCVAAFGEPADRTLAPPERPDFYATRA